ncbi:hypothetical protein [Microbispora rosea]|uniref:hypothetical protein n=1 Tax=Microbispora rosea TaxID=58117 RepID=UPI0034295170
MSGARSSPLRGRSSVGWSANVGRREGPRRSCRTVDGGGCSREGDELAVAALILAPATRTFGAWAAAALISGYLVSHLDAVRHARPGHPSVLLRPWGVSARLTVNLAYIGWAVVVALAAT